MGYFWHHPWLCLDHSLEWVCEQLWQSETFSTQNSSQYIATGSLRSNLARFVVCVCAMRPSESLSVCILVSTLQSATLVLVVQLWNDIGTYGLSCMRNAGRSNSYHQINDLIWRALSRSDVPATKEPTWMFRDDRKRPDGLTLVPWQNGRCLTWDATVVDSPATSYLSSTSSLSGSAAEAEAKQIRKDRGMPHLRSGSSGNIRTSWHQKSSFSVRN